MIQTNESFKNKILINLGLFFLLFIPMMISIFIGKWDIFERLMENRSIQGLLIGIIFINGIEWVRLESLREKV